ncbi:MAG: hypothetical protein ACRD72_23975, partial [Candidatus Angelobacter sp.]
RCSCAGTMSGMRLPLWLKIAWTLWVMVWAPVYGKRYGAQNLLYFCDLGNFFIAIGLWLESSLIFSWQATGLLLFQTLYTIDLIGAVVAGRHLIGGTEYMFDPGVPLPVRLLSMFHVVTPPLLLWALWRLSYDQRGWKFQTLTAWIVVPINYFWRPQYDVNWARGPFFREQHVVPGLVYLSAYLIVMPLLVYWPSHLALRWWARRRKIS